LSATPRCATIFEHRNVKVKFEYAVIAQADILKELHPTDDELRRITAATRQPTTTPSPKSGKIRYVVFDSAKRRPNTTVSDQEFASILRSAPATSSGVPEQVRSLIILSRLRCQQRAPRKMRKVSRCPRQSGRRLEAGQAAAILPSSRKKYSDDPGSAKAGGELGWMGRGRTVPESAKAAYHSPGTDQRLGQKQLWLSHHPL